MNFLPGWFPAGAAGAGGGGLTTVAYETHATSTSTTITVPSVVQKGDLLVLLDLAQGVLFEPTPVVPSGFTQIVNTLFGSYRKILSYKIADGNEASTSLTGMEGLADLGIYKILVVFRGNVPILTANVKSVNDQATNLNPAAQTVTASEGTPPLIVLGAYSSNSTVNPRTMNPAKDSEVNNSNILWLAWKIYTSNPADVTVDMDDEGNGNILQSCYIEVW